MTATPSGDPVHSGLSEIFRETFTRETKPLTPDLTAADVRGWDSMAHVKFIMTIEERFGIQFSNAELSRIQSIGALLDIIRSKTIA